jgi:hypothetical protein
MEDRNLRCSRRKFLAQAAALTMVGGISPAAAANEAASARTFRARPPKLSKEGRKPIAVICTVYRPLSHAYHIAGRFIQGYARDGGFHVPKHYVRTLYVDQVPEEDLSRAVGREFGIHVTRSVEDALTQGGERLAVEGVLLIGEHGNYPRNAKHQILYPRYELMQRIVSVFRKTGQTVPVFNDKHFSYSWAQAQEIYQWSQELKFPFMAGSSLPVTWRRPELELPLHSPLDDAVVAAYGPIEIYGFHGLEALEVMVERRIGGETGVKAVTCLNGNEVWRAGDAGLWSWDLLEAALGRSETLNPGDIRRNVGSFAVGNMPKTSPTAFVVEYRDGLRGTVLLLNGQIQDFCFAANLKGDHKPASCLFYLPPPPGAKYFDCLVANIEKFFETGKAPYPVERTLLTTGILAAAMESHYRKGTRIETPELDVHYAAPADSGFCRCSVANPV